MAHVREKANIPKCQTGIVPFPDSVNYLLAMMQTHYSRTLRHTPDVPVEVRRIGRPSADPGRAGINRCTRAAHNLGCMMKKMHKMILRAGLAAMALGMAGSASAAVTYTFDATSSYSAPFGSFVYTTPTFLTGDNIIPLANLTSCTVTFAPGGETCGDQRMDTNFHPSYETVGFGTASLAETYYYFNFGSFATVGTHSSQIFGAGQFATLTVSGFSDTAAVPEPATWAMMIFGFGLVGGGMRKANGRKTTGRKTNKRRQAALGTARTA